MNCQFEPTNQSFLLRCRECGYCVVTHHEPEKTHRECKPKQQDLDKLIQLAKDYKPPELAKDAKKDERPGLAQQAKGLIKDVGNFIMSGAKTVDDEEYNRRLEVCSKCEYSLNENTRCGKCGCILQLKARGAVWNCPLNKWGGV